MSPLLAGIKRRIKFSTILGVAHLANSLVKRIHIEQPELYQGESDEFRERDLKCVTLAGLCHDLGTLIYM